jgi:hypothetical protein
MDASLSKGEWIREQKEANFLLAAGAVYYFSYAVSKSAIHEIEALLFLLIGVVFLVAAVMVQELRLAQPSRVTAGKRSEVKGVCPACGLQNVPTASRCDCGYQFV